MLNANDLEQLKAKGISEKQIEEQLACFVKGFPFLDSGLRFGRKRYYGNI